MTSSSKYPWDEWLSGGLFTVSEAESPHVASALRTKAARVGKRVRTRRVDGSVLFQFEPEDGEWAPALSRAGAVAVTGACEACGRPATNGATAAPAHPPEALKAPDG